MVITTQCARRLRKTCVMSARATRVNIEGRGGTRELTFDDDAMTSPFGHPSVMRTAWTSTKNEAMRMRAARRKSCDEGVESVMGESKHRRGAQRDFRPDFDPLSVIFSRPPSSGPARFLPVFVCDAAVVFAPSTVFASVSRIMTRHSLASHASQCPRGTFFFPVPEKHQLGSLQIEQERRLREEDDESQMDRGREYNESTGTTGWRR